jgi:hypothetical protein
MRHLFLLENAQLRFQALSLALKKCWRKFLLLLSTKEGYYICKVLSTYSWFGHFQGGFGNAAQSWSYSSGEQSNPLFTLPVWDVDQRLWLT